MTTNYEKKYLKYKTKYLELKHLGAGKIKVYFFNAEQLEKLGINEVSLKLNKDLLKNFNNYLKETHIDAAEMYENSNEIILKLSLSDKLKVIKTDIKSEAESLKENIQDTAEMLKTKAAMLKEKTMDIRDSALVSTLMLQYNKFPEHAKSEVRREICLQRPSTGGGYKFTITKKLELKKNADGTYDLQDDRLLEYINTKLRIEGKIQNDLDSYLIVEEKLIGLDKILGIHFKKYKSS